MSNVSYIIGIDFGTTNCTLAYTLAELKNRHAPTILEQLPISQIIQSNTSGNSFSLPSFIYHLLPEEKESQTAAISWNPGQSFSVGSYARDRGGELPLRLISSAKSWLCHSGINRREKILPIEAKDENYKMSPIEACAEILRHLRSAWDVAMPNFSFTEQEILITVPASFDPSARQFIQEAAQLAGYPEAVLLEEPQAAFYAWLHRHAEDWRDQLKVGDSILVIDIGGGTTDFSLIGVNEEEGNLLLNRQAVGSHLLLGGDNIDLSLAYLVQQKFESQGHFLDSWQFQGLVHQCRRAKEKLLNDTTDETAEITVLGRGSRLIGNTLSIALSREEVQQLIIQGFVPLVEPEERSPIERRSGLQQVGLPYVQDARISCQLAKFLSMTGETDSQQMDQFVLPTAVLFNGGTLKAGFLRKRLLDLLNAWAKKLKKPSIKELDGADYDFAVSRGAVYYGLARKGHAVRIRSGTNRSYFVGVEEAMPAVPGLSPPLRAICIAPFGLEEGEERELEDQEFALLLGEQANFRFFSHSTQNLSSGVEPQVGTVVRNWKQELTELHPIETLLDKAEGDGKTIRIKLKSKVTELGALELWCIAHDGRRWKLEFNIRK